MKLSCKSAASPKMGRTLTRRLGNSGLGDPGKGLQES